MTPHTSAPAGPGHDAVLAALRAHPADFGLDTGLDAARVPAGTVAACPEPMCGVTLLGNGESYTAWAVDGTDLVVRVARRPLTDLPRHPDDEITWLRRVPPGIGPNPVLARADGGVLGAPYVVTSRVPGRVRTDPQAWTPELLARHARLLARLHATDRSPATLDAGEALAGGWAWWGEHHPDLVGTVEHLRPGIGRLERAASAAFARVRSVGLVHGDAVAGNVLVDDTPAAATEPDVAGGAGDAVGADGADGEVGGAVSRLVDWEWVGCGDGVRDVAFLGGPVAVEGVHVPLDGDALDRLCGAYAEATGQDAADVRDRVALWRLDDHVFTLLHYRSLLVAGTADARTVARERSLARALDAHLA